MLYENPAARPASSTATDDAATGAASDAVSTGTALDTGKTGTASDGTATAPASATDDAATGTAPDANAIATSTASNANAAHAPQARAPAFAGASASPGPSAPPQGAGRPGPAFSVCVYCGSRLGDDALFAQTAQAVGRWIGQHQGQLVYGGGHGGLMGVVADATLAAGGRVMGIIPKALVAQEWAHHGCTELHIVETMHERKRMMMAHADAFVALPGGIGTLEELFEVWTWRQLGYHDKPVGVLNTGGYYSALLAFMQHTQAQGFLSAAQMALIRVGDDPAALLQQLVQAAGFATVARLEAV